MLKLKAKYTPRVFKEGSYEFAFDVANAKTVMIIQITQFLGNLPLAIFVNSKGNINEAELDCFSEIEGAWRE